MRTLQVGPNSQYKSINTLPVLLPGDVIEIEPGIYHDARQWPIAGTPLEPVTVRAMAPGKTIFDGEGVQFAFTPRAIFEVKDGAYVFEGIKFRNAANGGTNAAAIRVIAGRAEILNCYLRNCDMGIHTTAAKSIVIRGNDIGWCGRGANSHNIYLSGGETSVIDNNRISRTIGGMNVKVRTRLAEIRNNQILDSVDGEIHATWSPLTLQPGSDCIVESNFIRTLATGRTNRARVIAFGHEGGAGTDRVGTLRLKGNRILMRSAEQILVSLDSVNAGLDASDNIIEGSNVELVRLRYGLAASNTGSRNRFRLGGVDYELDALPQVFNPPLLPPVDTTPPAPPSNLTATQTPTSIRLAWDPSSSPDVDHYEVIGPYGPFSMGEDNCYTVVAGLYAGRSYTYSVVAVDTSGNPSRSSNSVTIVKQ